MDETERMIRDKLAEVAKATDDRQVRDKTVAWFQSVMNEYYAAGVAQGEAVAFDRIHAAFIEGLKAGLGTQVRVHPTMEEEDEA